MYILLALIAAVALGVAVHFALPRRPLRGVALAPSLAGAAGAVAYGVCTWAGLGEANPWQWVISLVAAVAVSVGGTLLLTRVRAAHDEAEARRLGVA
ncbi:hypothetical protein [Microbacterium album]|uniref:Uncharacterized protein n=1 Tax=Microbacterium album TaxID=2053191 RepID=A0A917MNG8_9MICO|nr:hypothetical protein [Microbacterium album]GGH49534.1 hypothetical protein GCM10010921_27720 [Microbacterium album]